ncbi:hypothetical protein EVAR_76206_1 [Eumeta japonica]|uniref:Uncharacterized protein n=1 Tax=Eumeta variegata TaxID=151549 RepID=A0A4C1UNU0_EUMVA|nr:hypothetical protein EVAR_76206_1 [Eumeta japonica]
MPLSDEHLHQPTPAHRIIYSFPKGRQRAGDCYGVASALKLRRSPCVRVNRQEPSRSLRFGLIPLSDSVCRLWVNIEEMRKQARRDTNLCIKRPLKNVKILAVWGRGGKLSSLPPWYVHE